MKCKQLLAFGTLLQYYPNAKHCGADHDPNALFAPNKSAALNQQAQWVGLK